MAPETPSHNHDAGDVEMAQNVHGEISVASLPITFFWIGGVGRAAVAGEVERYDAICGAKGGRFQDMAE